MVGLDVIDVIFVTWLRRVHEGRVAVGEGAQVVQRYGLGSSLQRTGETMQISSWCYFNIIVIFS